MFSFGQQGAGVFPVPTVVAARIRKERGVQFVGDAERVREQFYAITVEEKPTHPAVVAICQAARRDLS
jgi:LysR family transcriptional activator of nhaA